MIFSGIPVIRRTNNRHLDASLATAGFAALLLIIGLGSRQANGFVIGHHNLNHAGGGHGEFVDIDKLKPLKEYKEEHIRRVVPEDGTFAIGGVSHRATNSMHYPYLDFLRA